tara:strand:- start:399 stop:1007 length:609 start_codon:yes stop_codon:yes gene_type:complete
LEFVAFDVETTGIDSIGDEIIEIGAVKFNADQSTTGFGCLINPKKPIPSEATSVNGITDKMVEDKPTIEEALPIFAEFCGELPLVAHNAQFDYKFILSDVIKYKSNAPKGCVLDTLSLARKVFPGMPNYKLWTLVRYFNFPSGTFHRAEEDSSYCGLLFLKILQTLKERNEPHNEEALLKLIGKDKLVFPKFNESDNQLDLF